ncbi:MAG: EAL domain-containing protein [Kordiimonadaceae bacterium]|nr:EAL domain-containing protein [Kordiimonadaceae bacterium]
MSGLPLNDLKRFSILYQALAPVVIELDADDIIVRVTGDAGKLLGGQTEQLCGQQFCNFIHAKDKAIWSLIRHRLKKARHVGPVPLRLDAGVGEPALVGAFEVHVALGDRGAGSLLLSLSAYQSAVSLGENKRPASSLARVFNKEDFEGLAQRLLKYAVKSETTVVAALTALAGIGKGGPAGGGPEVSLWTLYRLLYDAGSEGAAKNEAAKKRTEFEGKEKRLPHEVDTSEVDMSQGDVARAVQGAYVKKADETNYVTVAGEDGISESDAVKVAVYAMKKAASVGQAKTMQALTGGYEKRLETAKHQLRAFKTIVVQERFEVALQPIVNIKTGAVHHYEALARFDSDFYTGTPFEFMCFAEDVGVIEEFDLAMTLKVVTLVKRLRRIGYNIAVAVNVSGRSIQSAVFQRQFFRILEDCREIRHLLSFELTESSQIDDLEATNRILSRIRDFGHKVALDDFGAGAAGLQYLRVLKVDCVKIDGIYVRNAIDDEENRAFLRSMAELCAGLDIETVGECVETEEQRDFLSGIGVTYAQGWLYGKALPIDEVIRSLG